MIWLAACVFYTAAERDADGDGHAALAFGGDDCADTDSATHPGAEETCNGVDDDCDGTIDDDPVDTHEIYVDADADGWGSSFTLGCDAGVEQGGDCDDADATIHPGAVEDVCTAADENCDGDGAPDAPLARYGGEAGGTGGIGNDIAIGTPGNVGEVVAAASATAGVVLLFDPDNGALQESNARWARVVGAGEQVLVGPAFPQDDDADDDIVVSDSRWSDNTGRVSVMQIAPGGGDMDVDQGVLHYTGLAAGDRLGVAMEMRYNPGGTTVMLIGAPGTADSSGAAYVVPFDFTVTGTHTIDEGNYQLTTSSPGAALGSSVALWVDGGGLWWSFVGAPGWEGPYGTAGAVFACPYGGNDVSACGSWVGDRAGDGFGSVLSVGDVNGDGLDDLLIGAPDADWDGTSDAGAVWVIPGDRAGSGDRLDTNDASFAVGGAIPGQALGRSLASVGGRLYVGGQDVACGSADAGALYAVDAGGGGRTVADASMLFRSGSPGEDIGVALLAGADDALWVGAPGGSWVGLFAAE